MQKLVISKRIYTSNGCLDGAMLIDEGKIKQLFPRNCIPESYHGTVEDFGNHRIIPGIIEMHVHGYKGWSAFSSDVDEIRSLGKALTTSGVTAFTPTNHYHSHIIENAKALSDAIENGRYGARNLGVHMEGPFISPITLGSVSSDDVLKPDVEVIKTFYEATKGHINTVTLAPELPGNMEVIDWLVAHGVNVCIGHSDATYEQCIQAIDKGAIITQKTGNCMRQIHQREVGVVGAAMLDQRIFNEINSDLAHCSKEFLEILYRMKGYEKLCMIADNGRMSGLPLGRYEMAELGGSYVVGKDGLLRTSDGTIDGSAKSILDGIKNWVEIIHIPMEEAIVMASLNPAKVCHVDHMKGSICEGKDADYVVIDDTYTPLHTVVEGSIEYDYQSGFPYDNEIYSKSIVEAYS